MKFVSAGVLEAIDANDTAGRVDTDEASRESAGDLGGDVPSIEACELDHRPVVRLVAEHDDVGPGPRERSDVRSNDVEAEQDCARSGVGAGNRLAKRADLRNDPQLPFMELEVVVMPRIDAQRQATGARRRIDECANGAAEVGLAAADKREIALARTHREPAGRIVEPRDLRRRATGRDPVEAQPLGVEVVDLGGGRTR